MASSQLDLEIRQRVDSFVIEIADLVKQAALDSVGKALGEPGAARRGRGRPKRGATGARNSRSKGKKRSAQSLSRLGSRLHAEIQRDPGRRIEQIAAALRTSTKELALPVKKLLADEKIRTTGQKRATRYFAK